MSTMNRLLRPIVVAALAGGGLAASTTTAHANIEIGGTAGVHLFSKTNELGVNDVAGANSLHNAALFGVRLGVYLNPFFGVEGEFGVIPTEARETAFDVWAITYRGHLVLQLRGEKGDNKILPFLLFGGGAFQVVDNGGSKNNAQIAKDTDGLLYAGIGAKYRVDNGWGLRADARLLFPPSSKGDSFTEDWEFLLSIYKEFGRETKPTPPPVDNDPDHDGIIGAADKCPNDAEDKDGFQDDDGCPDPDNDGDGIADAADKCPNEPEDKDGFQDEDGCPDPDNDGDGVLDADDKCPTEPETKNGFQDEDGCPDEIPAKLKQFTGVVQGINFKVADAALAASSYATLDKAVAVLKEFGDLKMEIQGHTDDQPVKAGGKFPDNQALSQARAESVRAYFVSKGIDESRVTAKGYGDTVPVENPKDLKAGRLAAARAKNRRVEFKLISSLTQ